VKNIMSSDRFRGVRVEFVRKRRRTSHTTKVCFNILYMIYFINYADHTIG